MGFGSGVRRAPDSLIAVAYPLLYLLDVFKLHEQVIVTKNGKNYPLLYLLECLKQQEQVITPKNGKNYPLLYLFKGRKRH